MASGEQGQDTFEEGSRLRMLAGAHERVASLHAGLYRLVVDFGGEAFAAAASDVLARLDLTLEQFTTPQPGPPWPFELACPLGCGWKYAGQEQAIVLSEWPKTWRAALGELYGHLWRAHGLPTEEAR